MIIDANTNIHYTITYSIDKEKLLELRNLLLVADTISKYIEFEEDKKKLLELISIVEQLTDYNV
ncbi:MAG: hypothetical protein HC917_06340 [Richelia sp. SM2_1_7]|nr:hypothetical protein [Richelia sp. SM2_1_7]